MPRREIIIKRVKSIDDTPIHPGDLLKEYAMRNGLKQAQLASMCEFHSSNFGHYITQYRRWPEKLFLTAANVLDYDPEDLMILEYRYWKWERERKAADELKRANNKKSQS